ncbi:cytochrome b [Wolinella succinogenes]|uniref:UBIQUINOL CYTOCHROME C OXIDOREDUCTASE, CYTOCHROME B SUBUNIT (FBCH) n=1 Tax=Wolinella succinogenes (strain ATCC 29543 / DSM 1740 / CCUG 13145 / JCM 31913 / LMG 7466 / NCTC 11488 / FDC 602W) TaxID=273121 RepID=Q7M7Q1_WOLSU|nr:cytochrome bc complex cytochrome b subunit [Wolinella succinogenes]NLU34765.1 cytochrome bc complex cytochrome b subunit [Wolinella succinogenes]CAE11147.1 UBIQUINOL CYTOCHROME C OXIDOREDUCTASE, CYTOCHROME B SUBUNIT (FBCH) [Wolinella succinogenes]VEG81313.1 Cytochrome b [Wolinella succinogenes]HCZ19207.1 cytochrome bc complex cytochrome b subunit [Helicobacter sp.]
MAQIKKAEGFIDWLDQRLAVKKFMQVMMTEYWIPKNINFLWAMGVVLIVLFAILFVSGIFLLMYYKPDVKLAFDSVNYTIMQEVKYGWLWRHLHAVAASAIFLVIYIHMFVAIYYGSYKQGREVIWIGGMLLFMTFSAEAFSGYMLPWGQMSYWAAAVITNLFGGIPVIGPELVVWIRGNFVVSDATLTRFFMLHVVLLPVVIMALIAFHFYTLRFPHVGNELGEEIDFDKEAEKYKAGNKKEAKVIPFWPMFLSKDIFVVCVFMVGFFYLTFFHFNFAMDPINFEPADSMKTPLHIYPEWYFLWSYEVLRGFFFSSDLGLIAFGIANGIFLFMPWLDRSPVVAPAHKRPMFMIWFWALIADLIVLTVYGKLPPTGVNAYIGFVASIAFLGLFAALPFITSIEAKKAGRAS